MATCNYCGTVLSHPKNLPNHQRNLKCRRIWEKNQCKPVNMTEEIKMDKIKARAYDLLDRRITKERGIKLFLKNIEVRFHKNNDEAFLEVLTNLQKILEDPTSSRLKFLEINNNLIKYLQDQVSQGNVLQKNIQYEQNRLLKKYQQQSNHEQSKVEKILREQYKKLKDENEMLKYQLFKKNQNEEKSLTIKNNNNEIVKNNNETQIKQLTYSPSLPRKIKIKDSPLVNPIKSSNAIKPLIPITMVNRYNPIKIEYKQLPSETNSHKYSLDDESSDDSDTESINMSTEDFIDNFMGNDPDIESVYDKLNKLDKSNTKSINDNKSDIESINNDKLDDKSDIDTESVNEESDIE